MPAQTSKAASFGSLSIQVASAAGVDALPLRDKGCAACFLLKKLKKRAIEGTAKGRQEWPEYISRPSAVPTLEQALKSL